MLEKVTDPFLIIKSIPFATLGKQKNYEKYVENLLRFEPPSLKFDTYDFAPYSLKYHKMNVYAHANINFNIKQSTKVLDEHDKPAEQIIQKKQIITVLSRDVSQRTMKINRPTSYNTKSTKDQKKKKKIKKKKKNKKITKKISKVHSNKKNKKEEKDQKDKKDKKDQKKYMYLNIN